MRSQRIPRAGWAAGGLAAAAALSGMLVSKVPAGWTKTAVRPGVASMLTGNGCGTHQSPLAPSTDPLQFEVFEMTWPTAAVRAVYDELGITSIPLYGWLRCCVKEPEMFFDPDKFAERLNESKCDLVPPDVVGRMCEGVPEGWDSWVDIDLEAPFWTPIKNADEYTVEEQEYAVSIFTETILALRRARPQAKIAVHNMITIDPVNDPRGFELQCRIATICDATSPSMYLSSQTWGTDQYFTGREARMQRCLRMKAQLGVEVYPVVWKKWRDVDWSEGVGNAMPPEQVNRDHIRWMLDYELDGHRIDGIFIFCTKDSRDEATDIAYVQLIAEEIAQELQETAEETAEETAQEMGEESDEDAGDSPGGPRPTPSITLIYD